FGGCGEVLDWSRGTPYRPTCEALDASILFLETSEEAPPPSMLSRFIRSLACMGALDRLRGILLGRPGGRIDSTNFSKYEEALVNTIRSEYCISDMPIVTNMDFGHTDPIFVIPLGLNVRIDSVNRILSINESAVLPSGQQSAGRNGGQAAV